jgi:hypothetical protein
MSTNMLNERLYGHQSSLKKLDRADSPEEFENAIQSTALVKHAHTTGSIFVVR